MKISLLESVKKTKKQQVSLNCVIRSPCAVVYGWQCVDNYNVIVLKYAIVVSPAY